MFHQTNWNFPMVSVTRTKFYCEWQENIGGCCTKTASHSLSSAAQIQRQDLQYINIVQSMACTPMKNWQRDANNCWRNIQPSLFTKHNIAKLFTFSRSLKISCHPPFTSHDIDFNVDQTRQHSLHQFTVFFINVSAGKYTMHVLHTSGFRGRRE